MTCHRGILAMGWVFFLLSPPCLATITFSATGASNTGAPPGGSGTNYYYSNIATNYLSASTALTVGTCDTTVNPSCHNPGDPFVINATSTVSGGQMYLMTGSVVPTNSLTGTNRVTNVANGSPINTTFGAICAAASNTNCATNGTIALSLILDANSNTTYDSGEDILTFNLIVISSIPQFASAANTTGLYSFIAFPGDARVHMKNVVADTSFPASENLVGVQTVRFYYTSSANAFNDINPATSAFFPVGIVDATGTLASYFVGPLINDTVYYFKAALVDMAGNIGYLTPSQDDGSTVPNANNHVAKPGLVVGLLSKNAGCFVATAAFGSPLAPQVKILREFRDKVLLNSPAGQRFVNWYYTHGPTLASLISDSEGLKALVRFLLWPLVAFSWVALRIGAANASLLFSVILLFPLLVFRVKAVHE